MRVFGVHRLSGWFERGKAALDRITSLARFRGISGEAVLVKLSTGGGFRFFVFQHRFVAVGGSNFNVARGLLPESKYIRTGTKWSSCRNRAVEIFWFPFPNPTLPALPR
jgi:hypothetical protein